jgi:hypothetical protein
LNNESTFVPLLLITLLAAIVPVLVGHFGSGRLPIVVGEILAGNALVLGVRRAGEVVVPHGDTALERGDMLMLVGSPDSLREARPWLTYGIRVPIGDVPSRSAYPTNSKEEA